MNRFTNILFGSAAPKGYTHYLDLIVSGAIAIFVALAKGGVLDPLINLLLARSNGIDNPYLSATTVGLITFFAVLIRKCIVEAEDKSNDPPV